MGSVCCLYSPKVHHHYALHQHQSGPDLIPADGMARGLTYPVAPEQIIVAAKSLFTCCVSYPRRRFNDGPSLLHRWDGCSAPDRGALGRCSQWLGQQLGLMKVRPFPRGAPHCGTGVTFLTHGEIKGCWTLERPGGIEPALCTLEGCCPTTRPRSLKLAEAQGIEPSPTRVDGDEFQIRLPTFGACFLMC